LVPYAGEGLHDSDLQEVRAAAVAGIVPAMHDFTGEVVWITGASAGIGASLAREFASLGAIVCVSARRKDRLENLVEEIQAQGGVAAAYPCDVTLETELETVVQQIVQDHGKLDCAVANAGFAVSGRVESLKAEEWQRQFEVNVIGTAMTAKYALSELRQTKGRMVLVGSIMSMMTSPKAGAYSASKHAVRSIGQTLSLELHGSGVSCTTLHPGYIATEIAQVKNDGSFDEDREDRRPAKLMWSADRAARVMIKAIAKRKREHVFTGHGKIGGYMGRHFPGLVHFAQTRR
jgi:short-subunit dehydrogenase